MSDAGSMLSRRDPLRPPAPVPVPERAGYEPGLIDYWHFFKAARRNLLTAFSDVSYRELLVKRSFLGTKVWVLCDPDAIKRVLLDNVENYPKSGQQVRRLAPALGKSMLLAEGEPWRWQRRTTAPAFQHRRITGFAPAMVAAAEDMLARWESEQAHERNIADDMMSLTFDVLSRTVFGASAPLDVRRMGKAFEVYFDTAAKLDMASMLNLPQWVPTIGRMRARPALKLFRQEVNGAIQRRRAELSAHPDRDTSDLLAMLLTARDPETGQLMDDSLVYDNALTFIAAGHETTANALNWTFMLLSLYPWAEAKVMAELGSVLNGRSPTAEDVPKLVYLRQVFDETLRLYPPAPFIMRDAIADDTLCAQPLSKGTQILIPIWVLHRHRQLWHDADLFDPERFASGNRESIHRFAYIPFGAGPRVCIGTSFALQEAMLLLATILQRYRLTLKPGHIIEPHAAITLRPRGGLPMLLQRRRLSPS